MSSSNFYSTADQVILSRGATGLHKNRLLNNEATYGNNTVKDGQESGVVAGYVMNEDGSWEIKIPLGTPKDFVGRAMCDMKQLKAKHDIRNRLRAKLESKKTH